MPAEESTPAIVLRARDYADADRIVTLLTRDQGKLSGIAKGAKASHRRFERKLEPFSQVTLYFRRRPHGQLVFITRAERGDLPPAPVEDDLAKIALGSYMLELADALTSEEAEATAAYEVLTGAIAAMSAVVASNALRQAYELHILNATGFGLEFAYCRACSAPVGGDGAIAYFVPARGGVICQGCRPASEGGVRLGAASIAALEQLARSRFSCAAATSACAGEDGRLAISRFLATILDRKLRSLEFLNSIL
ncbi:MAG: DNA repair protein RecO [Candidatus Binataceae bacterium]